MKNTIQKGVALTMLLMIISVGVSYAKSSGTKIPSKNFDPVQTQNKRHKTPHTDRKMAAKHLRTEHQQELNAKLQKWTHEHQGYSGRGHANTHPLVSPKLAKSGG